MNASGGFSASDQVTSYKCPACTAPLHFEAATGQLECAFCSSVFSVEQVEAFYAEQDAKAAQAYEQARAKEAAERERAAAEAAEAAAFEAGAAGAEAPEGGWGAAGVGPAGEASGAVWDTSTLGSWTEQDAVLVYNCPSCGAELICDETTAATACPYCDNPTIVPSKLVGSLKPDFVIPFKLKKEHAIAALKRHYKGRPFLPHAFKDENHLDEIKGIYVPFWLFDGQAEGSAMYRATRSIIMRRGDSQVTQTSHFNVLREGSVSFSRIPVDASKKMDNDYMDSLEPYDYSEMKPFSTAYLPGYFADKYDDSIEECSARADARAEATLVESLRNSVVGYEAVFDVGRSVSLRRGEVKYALIPVWLLNTTWNGQRYMFAMNGQTGKFVGHLPTDKALRRKMMLKVYGISLAVCAAIAVGLGLFELLSMLGG